MVIESKVFRTKDIKAYENSNYRFAGLRGRAV